MTSYRISEEMKLIFMRIQGELSAQEIVNFLAEVSIDDNYNRSFNSILDLQNFKNTLSATEAQHIIESASNIRGEVRVKSAVVTNGIFRKVLVDTASALHETKSIKIKGFTNMTDACRWLHVDEEALS